MGKRSRTAAAAPADAPSPDAGENNDKNTASNEPSSSTIALSREEERAAKKARKAEKRLRKDKDKDKDKQLAQPEPTLALERAPESPHKKDKKRKKNQDTLDDEQPSSLASKKEKKSKKSSAAAAKTVTFESMPGDPPVDPLFSFNFVPNPSTSTSSELPVPPAQFHDHSGASGGASVQAPPGPGDEDDIQVATGAVKRGKTSTNGKAKAEAAKEPSERKSKKDKKRKKDKDNGDGDLVVNGDDATMQIDPLLIAIDADKDKNEGNVQVKGKGKRAKDKGKGKERVVASDDEDEEDRDQGRRDATDEEQAYTSTSHGKKRSKSLSTSDTAAAAAAAVAALSGLTADSAAPRRIRVGPVASASTSTSARARSPSTGPPPTSSSSFTDPLKPKLVFDPTDDSSVSTIEQLDQDPDFVRPIKRSGPFFDILQTKWTPVKELKKLAQEYGETYKQGKFSNSEDRLIKATIKSFRERSGMTSEELVTHINSKRATSASTEYGFGTNGKKDKGAASAAAAGVSYGGALSEMWLNLGEALQERALLGIWNRVRRMYNPDSGKGPWTPEEDGDLARAVKEYGGSSWEKIASSVGRPSSDCRDRWVKQLGAGTSDVVKKGKWTKDEEDLLVKLHAELGNSWTAITKRMGGTRTATQCRIKWSDSLSRKTTTQQPTPEVEVSSSVATPRPDGEDGDADRAWQWKQEYFSTLVHAVARMKAKDESEIDFSTITDPTLKPQGIKNLRDRFKRLRQGAIFDLRERDGLDEDTKVSYQAMIDHLLELYPKPGVAYKRTYRAPEQRRLAKQGEKEDRKMARAEERRLRKEGKLTGAESGDAKSSAVVEDSSDDDEDEDSE